MSKPDISFKVVFEFDNACAFKNYLEGINEKQSGVHFLLYADIYGLNFFIPMWHYRDGEKLWIAYDEGKKCYTVNKMKVKYPAQAQEANSDRVKDILDAQIGDTSDLNEVKTCREPVASVFSRRLLDLITINNLSRWPENHEWVKYRRQEAILLSFTAYCQENPNWANLTGKNLCCS